MMYNPNKELRLQTLYSLITVDKENKNSNWSGYKKERPNFRLALLNVFTTE